MASNAMDTLRGILGDNADEKIKVALDSLGAGGSASSASDTQAPNDALKSLSGSMDSGTLDSVMQIRDIVQKLSNSGSDNRANLLLSLRPFMRTTRQGSIDTAVRMLNLSKLSGLFRLR